MASVTHVVTKIRNDRVRSSTPARRPAQPVVERATSHDEHQIETIPGTPKAEIPAVAAVGRHQPVCDAWFMRLHRQSRHRRRLGNDDNSPTKKATGGGLPVEVWTRFMKAAHQGVPVASLPNAAAGGFFSSLMRTTSQVSAPTSPSAQAPVPLAPTPSGGGYRPPSTRTSAPSARPEPAAGLDGWLVDRLFGGR
jgi:penicillin-binding protein 1A